MMIRKARPFIFIFLFMVAACGTLPQPFQGAERNDMILDNILVNPAVMIAPVIGLPPPLNHEYAETIAKSAQGRDVAALTRAGGKASSLLQGQARAETSSDGSKTILIEWTLTGPDGLKIDDLITQQPAFAATADDPWLVYANTDLTPTTRAVSQFLFDWLYRPTELAALPNEPAQILPQIDGVYRLHIGKVIGARGDGNVVLQKAMNDLLSQGNISLPLTIEGRSSGDTYTIACQVSMKDLSAEIEIVRLDWQLLSPEGDVLGSVKQENQIARGSLDEKWGLNALYAVEGAAEGLLNLLLQFPTLGGSQSAIPANDGATLRGAIN